MKKLLFLLCMGILASGCAGINYSYVSPEAKNFHPQSMAILPVMVGDYQAAGEVIDKVVSDEVVDTEWFSYVVDSIALRNQLSTSPALGNDVVAYIQKLTTLDISDEETAKKIANTLKVDALFLASVTSWGYELGKEDVKIGKVGLGIKLVCGKKGIIIWKANHEEIEDYWLIKPSLADIAEEVMEELLDEMPR